MKSFIRLTLSLVIGASVGTACLLLLFGAASFSTGGTYCGAQVDPTSILILGSGFSVIAVVACGLSQILGRILSAFEAMLGACLYGGALPVSTVLLINTRYHASTAGECSQNISASLGMLAILVLSSASCAAAAAVVRQCTGSKSAGTGCDVQ